MIIPGLVSVTFRKLKPDEIVKLVKKAGLSAIEWGGDIHVPHGDLKTAREVSKLTCDYGLKTAAYGSYYRLGCEDKNFDIFKKVLYTAAELKAPNIRVWVGEKGSLECNESQREKITEAALQIASIADEASISISCEFHGGTLTDSNESAVNFYKSIGHPNIKAYWQPATTMNIDERMKGLELLSPILSNVHVFQWSENPSNLYDQIRHDLEFGYNEWRNYISYISKLSGDHYSLLEFVKADEPEQFLKDAETLKKLIDISSL